MKRWLGSILLAALILHCIGAWAQNDTGTSDTSAPTQPGPKPAYTYPDATPSLDFLNGAVENSSITLGIGAGVSYLSNGYRFGNGAANNAEDRWLFNVTPSIKIQQFRPRLSWNVFYSGGYQTYTQPSTIASGNYNLFAQNASAGLLWQFTPHWQLAANDSFTYTSNPFDSYLTHVGTPTLNDPNPITYSSITQYTLNNAFLALTDQLTKADTLTFTGTTNYRHTSNYNLVTSVPFYNLTSYGGRVSYSHRLSPRLSLGAGYDYNSLDFGHGYQRSGIQTPQMTVEYLIRPNMSISGWIGPQYTSTKTVLGIPIFGQIVYVTSYDSVWSTAVGANWAWRGLRNSFGASFVRGVSDGGGIIATSVSTSVIGSYRRMITTKWDATLGAQYRRLVSTTTSSRSYDYYDFNAALNYKLTKSFSASVRYAYLRYNQSNAFLIDYGNYADNIVGASINYTWSHPLGR
jgi:hypothetical protein